MVYILIYLSLLHRNARLPDFVVATAIPNKQFEMFTRHAISILDMRAIRLFNYHNVKVQMYRGNSKNIYSFLFPQIILTRLLSLNDKFLS